MILKPPRWFAKRRASRYEYCAFQSEYWLRCPGPLSRSRKGIQRSDTA